MFKSTVMWHSRKLLLASDAIWSTNPTIHFSRYRCEPWNSHMWVGDNAKHRRICVARVITKRNNEGLG